MLNIKVYDIINLPGSWSVNNRLQSMLEECGSICDPDSDPDPCSNVSNGDLNNDDITNIGDVMMTISYILYNLDKSDHINCNFMLTLTRS